MKRSGSDSKETKMTNLEQAKLCDQLKFEINEMKIKLNEIGQLREKNVSSPKIISTNTLLESSK